MLGILPKIYSGLTGSEIGRKILPASHPGSKRWSFKRCQDGYAICRKFKKPDLFITMTTNPKWPEIQNNLNPGENAEDRPDLISRVFNLYKNQLIEDITKKYFFGKTVGSMYVVEYQKRGLPHCHLLVILDENFRIKTAKEVDEVICAELPPDPTFAKTPEGQEQLKVLGKLVREHMIHHCTEACNMDGNCSKQYPFEYQNQTIVGKDFLKPLYRRKAGPAFYSHKKKAMVDNKFVVPYNPALLLKFQCHMNVEICCSATASKYLFKYVTKGCDRAIIGFVSDEIEEYADLRSYCPAECCAHLFGHEYCKIYPPVQAMRIHLENQQPVRFEDALEEECLENQRITELTQFFKFNLAEVMKGTDQKLLPAYVDMNDFYRYDQKGKQWIKRSSKSENKVVGRIHAVSPRAGDVFYLRMLLHDSFSKGKVSFKDMLTLDNGIVCETYQEVCKNIGLLADDNEWILALEEASKTKLCSANRDLFITILMFCHPKDPKALFEKFWKEWIDDLVWEQRKKGHFISEAQCKLILLLKLE